MHTFSSKPSGKRGHAALQSGGYAAHREAAQRQTDQSLAGRDIGELPEVADPERKEACRTDFRRFCEVYDEPEKVVARHASSTESTVAECAEERSSKGRCRRHGKAALKGPRAGVVRVGVIGKERGATATPHAVRFKAFIRCNGSLETPLMFRPEQMLAKGVSNLGASFGAYSGRVLSGTSDECVPEGRALFSSKSLTL